MSSSSLTYECPMVPSSSSSSHGILPPPPWRPEHRRVFIIEEVRNHHRPAEPQDAVVVDGMDPLINRKSDVLLLREYDNTNPQEGDLWLHGDNLWAHLNGVTIPLIMGAVQLWDVGRWDDARRWS